METAVNVILPLLEQLLPVFGAGTATTATVAAVVKGLQVVVPVLPQIGALASEVVPKIKTIITAAGEDENATEEQLAALSKLDADSDAAFDAAVAAAETEDAKSSSS